MRALLLPFALSFTLAALPPLSLENQRSWSSAIVRGKVLHQSENLHSSRRGHSDTRYTARVRITEVEKGSEIIGDSGEVTVAYWKVKSRPQGWAGPQGQNSVLEVGSPVRLFLSQSEGDNTLHLLSPNGWAPDLEDEGATVERHLEKLSSTPPPLVHSRRQAWLGSGKVRVTRDVTPEEAPWLEQTVSKGTVLRIFTGHTHGIIGKTGVAVRWDEPESDGDDDATFFEIPTNSVTKLHDEL